MEVNRNIPRMRFNTVGIGIRQIEHKLRQGKNRLAMFQQSSIDAIGRK